MTDTPSHGRPSVAEVAALTARLRALSKAGRDADPAEVDRFLADKRDLIDRIAAADDAVDRGPTAGHGQPTPEVDRDPDVDHYAEPGGVLHRHVVRGFPPDQTATPPSADMIADQIARARYTLVGRDEEDRRTQLARWHTDDTSGGEVVAADLDEAPVRDNGGRP